MLGVHKTISLPQSTDYAKEMARWEAFPSQWGAAGRPYQFREYPKLMYKAEFVPGKGTQVADRHTVNDEHEERNMLSRGFHPTLQASFDAIRLQQTEHGKLAAEMNHEIKQGRISPAAAAEVEAAREEFGARHMPVVPETPVKRRGRKSNAEKAAAAAQ